MDIKMLFNESDTFSQSNKRNKCSTSKSHDQKSYPRYSLMSSLPIESDYPGNGERGDVERNWVCGDLGWGVENGDIGG